LADPVVITTDSANRSVYYYTYEWTNQRLGKAITSIQLNGTQGFKDYKGDMISENAIYLIAVSHVERRSPDDSHRARFDLSHSRQQVLGHSGKIIGYSVQEQHL
jgi:hypothetical protein